MTTEDENNASLTGEPMSGQRTESRRYGQGPGRPPSRQQRILAWLADRNWDFVSEARAAELAQTFPDCPDDTRRAALLESRIPLAPLIAGVVQDSYKHLEGTLSALLTEYLAARESGEAPRRQLIRSIVIRAKEHTELAAHNPKTHDLKRAVKLEMALWLRTWLENPPLFPAWVQLRKRQIFGAPPETAERPAEEPSEAAE